MTSFEVILFLFYKLLALSICMKLGIWSDVIMLYSNQRSKIKNSKFKIQCDEQNFKKQLDYYKIRYLREFLIAK